MKETVPISILLVTACKESLTLLKYCLKGRKIAGHPSKAVTYIFYCGPLNSCSSGTWGWSGGAMVLGKLPVPGRPTIWITVGQGPTALAVGAGGGCLDIFTFIYPFSPLSPSL